MIGGRFFFRFNFYYDYYTVTVPLSLKLIWSLFNIQLQHSFINVSEACPTNDGLCAVIAPVKIAETDRIGASRDIINNDKNFIIIIK